MINQRINQATESGPEGGNVLHVFRVEPSGKLAIVESRHLKQDDVNVSARPQGVVALDLL